MWQQQINSKTQSKLKEQLKELPEEWYQRTWLKENRKHLSEFLKERE
jgi:hypothetical protein